MRYISFAGSCTSDSPGADPTLHIQRTQRPVCGTVTRMPASRRNAIALVAGAVVLIVASSASGAVATKLITGADIKDGSITGKDLKPGTVRATHLHESAEGSGIVYTSRGFDGTQNSRRALTPRAGYALSTANDATIATVNVNIPKGTYLVSVTGQMTLYTGTPISTSNSLYVSCDIKPSSSTEATNLPYYQLSAPATSNSHTTIANEAIITLSATSTLIFRCQVMNLANGAPAPSGTQIGDAYADMVVTSVSTNYSSG